MFHDVAPSPHPTAEGIESEKMPNGSGAHTTAGSALRVRAWAPIANKHEPSWRRQNQHQWPYATW